MPSRLSEWWGSEGEDTIVSADVISGGIIGVGVLIAGYFFPQHLPGPAAFYVEIALGGAILAVVLTALSILVAFLGDEYVALLENSGGVKHAVRPYRVVAYVAGAEILFGLTAILTWSFIHQWGQIVLAAVTTGLVVCAVVGTIQIINITAWHGVMRARMPEIRQAARDARTNRAG